MNSCKYFAFTLLLTESKMHKFHIFLQKLLLKFSLSRLKAKLNKTAYK